MQKKTYLAVICILLLLVVMQTAAQPHKQHDERAGYCQFEDFATDINFFRATMLGESRDRAIARKKALINARGQLAGNIQAIIRSVFDVYTTSDASADRYEYLTRQIVKKKITGMVVVCSKTVKLDNGLYRSYVAVELPRSSVVGELNRQTVAGEGLQEGYRFTDFEQKLKDEMEKAGREKHNEIIIR